MDDLEQLIGDLRSHDGMTRKRAREGLVLVGTPAAPRVREFLTSPDKRVRWEAVKTLATIADPESLGEFIALLDDPSSDLRWLAATGLIRLGPRSVRPVLRILSDPKAPRGRLEMGRRVLGALSSDDQVLAGVVAPLMEVINGNDQAVIAERAARALSDFDAVS
jgi:HEAT repeat protein